MSVIQPTVGRVVWFWPSRGSHEPKPSQPYAAMVAYVHSDRMVNLSYVDHSGYQHPARSVPLVQEGDEAPHGYYAEWMPYQKGQAVRTEEAERLAREARDAKLVAGV